VGGLRRDVQVFFFFVKAVRLPVHSTESRCAAQRLIARRQVVLQCGRDEMYKWEREKQIEHIKEVPALDFVFLL
jgi:hypothetical protein